MLKKIGKDVLAASLAILILVGVPGSLIAFIIGAEYVYNEGYFGSYWEHRDSIYDPKLGQMRCLDDNGNLSEDLDPPCVLLTGRGLKTVKRYQKSCEATGILKEWCRKEAWNRVFATRPKS